MTFPHSVVLSAFSFLTGKSWKCQREETLPFSARPPHQNVVPLPEADRREAEEEKEIQVFKKGAENALKLAKFEMPTCKN